MSNSKLKLQREGNQQVIKLLKWIFYIEVSIWLSFWSFALTILSHVKIFKNQKYSSLSVTSVAQLVKCLPVKQGGGVQFPAWEYFIFLMLSHLYEFSIVDICDIWPQISIIYTLSNVSSLEACHSKIQSELNKAP